MTPTKVHQVPLSEDAEAPLEGDAMPHTPQIGSLGDAFDSRDHFSEHMKKLAISLGFRLASRGSYPKKPRQDLCLACTIGRRKGKRGTTKDVVQDHVPCPVVVTGKLQVDENGVVREGAKFEITQVNIAHNHPLGFYGEDDEEEEEDAPQAKSKSKKRKRGEADVASHAGGSDVEDDGSSAAGQPPVPLRLPKIGDLFRTWDDFRLYSRLAAETHGFTLGTAQSKGSSGTVVLRCSKFRDPNVPSTGSKPIEGGCEVMFKVTKSKKVPDAFECVQTFEEHNHPLEAVAPPKKKKKRADPPHHTLLLGDVNTFASAANPPPTAYGFGPPDGMMYGAPPPSASMPPSGGAPMPFLFDPYTGQRLGPAPPPGDGAYPYPPPPGFSGPPPMPGQYPGYAPAGFSPYGPPPGAVPPPEPIPAPPSSARLGATLNVRFPAKAHTSISDFLTTLSGNLTAYADHFVWAGVSSPLALLDVMTHGEGEAEVEQFLEEIDTAGYGRGEGLMRDECDLVIRGLRKLKAVRDKMGKSAPMP